MKIIITRGCWSDYPVSDPIIEAMEKDDTFKMFIVNLVPADFKESFNIMDHSCVGYEPDLVLIVGDRIEQAGACNAAFLHNVPICHLGAGIINYPISTFDDIFRHNITSMAEIALCESEMDGDVVFKLWRLFRKIGADENVWDEKIHVIGNLYAEKINDINEKLVPPYEYDLILYNPVTIDPKKSIEDYQKFLDFFANERNENGEPVRKIVAMGSNPDPSSFKNSMPFHYSKVPRPQFLGLMKNCERFITNSSSSYTEAPYLLKEEQIIRIGIRNKDRSTPVNFETGSAEKVIKILKDWWDAKYE